MLLGVLSPTIENTFGFESSNSTYCIFDTSEKAKMTWKKGARRVSLATRLIPKLSPNRRVCHVLL